MRDQNAYTRARVLQTWAHLAEKMAVPLGHWVCVTQIAVGAFPDLDCFAMPVSRVPHVAWNPFCLSSLAGTS